MSKQPIPIILLLEMNDNGNIDSLRVWMRLKKLYKAQIIYNFNYHALSQASGFSRTTLRKHIPILVQYGMIVHHGNHLMLTGVNKLKRHVDSKCALIPVIENKNKQIHEIRYAVVRNNMNRQIEEIARKENSLRLLKSRKAKVQRAVYSKIKKAGGLDSFTKSLQTKTILSNKGFGRLFSLSIHSGRKIQDRLRKLKLIKTDATYILVKKNATKFEADYLGGKYKIIGSWLYKRGANAINNLVRDTKKTVIK